MSDSEKNINPSEEEGDSKGSSEATAPQASPKKGGPGCNSDFHHHVVPTEKSGALNVYIQVIKLHAISRKKLATTDFTKFLQ